MSKNLPPSFDAFPDIFSQPSTSKSVNESGNNKIRKDKERRKEKEHRSNTKHVYNKKDPYEEFENRYSKRPKLKSNNEIYNISINDQYIPLSNDESQKYYSDIRKDDNNLIYDGPDLNKISKYFRSGCKFLFQFLSFKVFNY